MTAIKLTYDNHQAVLALFGDERDHYRFLLHDLVDHRYESDSFRVFGTFEDGLLTSILLNNYNNLTYYTRSTEQQIDRYLPIWDQLAFNKISCPTRLIEQLLPYVEVVSHTQSYLGVVREVILQSKYPELHLHTITTDSELGMHYDLLGSVEEYELNVEREDYIRGERKG